MRPGSQKTWKCAKVFCCLWIFALLPFPGLSAKGVACLQHDEANLAPSSKLIGTSPVLPPIQSHPKPPVMYQSPELYKLVYSTKPDSSDFLERLNEAAAQGYYVVSAVAPWRKSAFTRQRQRTPVALLKFDEVPHEYAVIKTAGKDAYVLNDFEKRYAELAQQGFRLVQHFLPVCVSTGGESGETCEKYDYLFLFERPKGVGTPTRFIVARDQRADGLSVKVRKLKEQIKQKRSDGFYPADLLSECEPVVVLTQPENAEAGSDVASDVVIVLLFERRTQLINEWAQKGYRLGLLDTHAALMYRSDGSARPLTYAWLSAGNQNFDAELAKLQASGAIYRSRYANDQLAFEQGEATEQAYQYRVLDFEFHGFVAPNRNKDGELIDLTPASKHSLELLNSLTSEGFRAREIFTSSTGVRVLLERSVKS
jgi:hypothetical protein